MSLGRRVCLLLVFLGLAGTLSSEGGEGGGAASAPDLAPGALSAQDRAAIEEEGVLGGSGAGADTPAGLVVAYQVGAFQVRAHAERLMESLATADFAGYLYTKKVGGVEYWAILVSASNIPFENRADELAKAGFPSFPVTKSALDAEFKLVPGQ